MDRCQPSQRYSSADYMPTDYDTHFEKPSNRISLLARCKVVLPSSHYSTIFCPIAKLQSLPLCCPPAIISAVQEITRYTLVHENKMRIDPMLPTTRRGKVPWEWVPLDFPGFVQELLQVVSHNKDINHLALYRGHRERDWLLDCTFVRYVKEHILGIDPTLILKRDYRLSTSYQRLMGELFLYKFGTSTGPHADLLKVAEKENIDPWFEYMKNIQQYPNKDLGTLRGSFLVDWTQLPEVATYFANDGRRLDSEGAVWVADMSAMGAVLHQDMQVIEILRLFEDTLRADKSMGIPLIFCPRNQIACVRARNQDAIYVAQMDLRCDLAEVWNKLNKERKDTETVVLKLILPKGTAEECTGWLDAKGIHEAFIYPDREDGGTS